MLAVLAVYIPYDDKGKWMFDLIGELKAYGYNVSKIKVKGSGCLI